MFSRFNVIVNDEGASFCSNVSQFRVLQASEDRCLSVIGGQWAVGIVHF